jgi:thioredoxin 1
MFRFLLGTTLAVMLYACTQAQSTSAKFSATEFADKIKNTPEAQLVDVRTKGEFKGGHIANASNVELSSPDFKDMAAALDKDKPVLVYCLSGGRSAKAAEYFRKEGFKEVYEMPGGMMEWRSKNLPEVKLVAASDGISLKEYEAMLQSNKIILVDFYAEWCAPCKKMKPFLEKISEDLKESVTVIRIDADQNPALCKEMGVAALPVLKIYKGQKETWNHTGFVDEETLRQQLK